MLRNVIVFISLGVLLFSCKPRQEGSELAAGGFGMLGQPACREPAKCNRNGCIKQREALERIAVKEAKNSVGKTALAVLAASHENPDDPNVVKAARRIGLEEVGENELDWRSRKDKERGLKEVVKIAAEGQQKYPETFSNTPEEIIERATSLKTAESLAIEGTLKVIAAERAHNAGNHGLAVRLGIDALTALAEADRYAGTKGSMEDSMYKGTLDLILSNLNKLRGPEQVQMREVFLIILGRVAAIQEHLGELGFTELLIRESGGNPRHATSYKIHGIAVGLIDESLEVKSAEELKAEPKPEVTVKQVLETYSKRPEAKTIELKELRDTITLEVGKNKTNQFFNERGELIAIPLTHTALAIATNNIMQARHRSFDLALKWTLKRYKGALRGK